MCVPSFNPQLPLQGDPLPLTHTHPAPGRQRPFQVDRPEYQSPATRGPQTLLLLEPQIPVLESSDPRSPGQNCSRHAHPSPRGSSRVSGMPIQPTHPGFVAAAPGDMGPLGEHCGVVGSQGWHSPFRYVGQLLQRPFPESRVLASTVPSALSGPVTASGHDFTRPFHAFC